MFPTLNTFLVSLELILVSAGEVVLEDGRGDSVQPGLAFISQTSRQIDILEIRKTPIILMIQKGKSHFCSLLGSNENSSNCRFFPILTAKNFSKITIFALKFEPQQILFSIS